MDKTTGAAHDENLNVLIYVFVRVYVFSMIKNRQKREMRWLYGWLRQIDLEGKEEKSFHESFISEYLRSVFAEGSKKYNNNNNQFQY